MVLPLIRGGRTGRRQTHYREAPFPVGKGASFLRSPVSVFLLRGRLDAGGSLRRDVAGLGGFGGLGREWPDVAG